MKQNNLLIRAELKSRGLHYYELAELLGMSDNTLFRRLRKELPVEEQERIVSIIKEGNPANT